MRKLTSKLLALLLFLSSFSIIYYFFQSVQKWYLNKIPALGVDLFLSVTYASYQLKNFTLPFNGFKDFWFAGNALMWEAQQLSFYLMVPFTYFYGPVVGVQTYALFTFFLFLIFSYLLFFRLSKNFGLSLFLTVGVLLSANIYGTLIWAGSIPYWGSQVIFPLGLFFASCYLFNPTSRYLSLIILTSGIGFLLHPLGVVTFLAPSTVFIMLSGAVLNSFSKKRMIKHLSFYLIGVYLAAFSIFYELLFSIVKGILNSFRISSIVPTNINPATGSAGLTETSKGMTEFYSNQVGLLITQTNNWLFVVLAVSVIVLIPTILLIRSKRKLMILLPFILIALYTAAHPYLNLTGKISFLRHDVYRAFWPFPVALAALSAVIWGLLGQAVTERFKTEKIYLKASKVLLAFVFFGIFGFLAYLNFKENINQLITTNELKSELSSTYPEAVSIYLKKDERDDLKKQLIPSFMNPNDKNKRLYAADATVNIWWKSFFEMPLVRGYIDPPIGTDRRGSLFLLDISIANDSITRDFKISEEQALPNTLFLMDWYGIYYFEGGRLGSKGPSPGPSSFLIKNNIFDKQEEVKTYGAVIKWGNKSGKPELHMELPQTLKYFKVADKYTSPILAPTNAPAVLIIGNYAGFEDILRIFGVHNLNSKVLIPVNRDEYIDNFSLEELKNFKAVIVHQYKYRNYNKAFSMLENYVKQGGNLFIDTGSETAESNSNNLPAVFPVKTSQRMGMGKEWKFNVEQDQITKDIDFSKFAPLNYNGSDWKLVTPKSDSDLRENSKVILRHEGKPVMITRKIGAGEIVWSGMNLPYHFNQFKIIDESNLFINIIRSFMPLNENNIPDAKTNWIKPEKVKIDFEGNATGVLFKEEGYDGWSASLLSEKGKKLPIYLAGPTYPGFMYVPLRKTDSKQISLEFNYNGIAKYWIITFINLAVIVFLLERSLFNGKLFGKRSNILFIKLSIKLRKKIGSWWEKEEE